MATCPLPPPTALHQIATSPLRGMVLKSTRECFADGALSDHQLRSSAISVGSECSGLIVICRRYRHNARPCQRHLLRS